MNDILLGLILLVLISGGLFALGGWLGRTLAKRDAMLMGIAVVGAILAYIALLSDNLMLAAILPYSNLVVVGNWIPMLTSLLAGLAWSLIPRQQVDAPGAGASRNLVPLSVRIRRFAVVVMVQAVGWVAVVRPLWGIPPRCHDRWDGEICIQTSDASCSAACAATLLKAHGIKASEQEMANLCLTRSRGTLWQGLYRGLKLKTAGTPWDVAVVQGPFAGLRSLGDRPAILAAGIPREAEVARIYTERYGWTPGEWHSVLFFGFRGNGLVAMGDPTPGIGLENWSEDDLRTLWAGRGMRLVPRRPGGEEKSRDARRVTGRKKKDRHTGFETGT